MEWYWAVALLFGLIVALMLLGMPIAMAFLASNIIAAMLFMGGAKGIGQVLNNGFGAMTSFALVPIPMFLLMGELFYYTGLAARMFNAIDKLLGNIRGRLAYVTVIGGTGFAALSGSSMGSTALLGSLMVPEMMKRGYSKYLSMGPIMGTGGLAVIIPPSALAVLLATLGRSDVGALLLAGVIPGVVLATLYALLIFFWTSIAPHAAPPYRVQAVPLGEKLRLVVLDIVPMILVIVLVIGIMVAGYATPTEAAAVGCLAVMVLAACYRALTWNSFRKSVDAALRVTVMAFLIIFGSATFSQILAFSGASSGLISWATQFDVSKLGMLLIMMAIIFFLGCFMDQLSMMLLTAPIFFPLAKTLGFDLTWFGLIMLLALEVGYTTPPFGLLLFVMKGVAPAGTTMREIYFAAVPFIACVLVLIGLIIAFPPLATWLPGISR
ncbi:MAG TPA: TRAP transporter large permease subunit [Burkholderiales bacterium]|jgi:tripartite ATP-independent transporter DctM subunit|nr:TRAP transporter large permease subunit [Burkholderiales bacterium]